MVRYKCGAILKRALTPLTLKSIESDPIDSNGLRHMMADSISPKNDQIKSGSLPFGIKLISGYNIFGAIICLVIGALGVAASNVLSSIIFLSLGVFLCGITVGILKLQTWARALHIAFYSIAILMGFFALLANASLGNVLVQGSSMLIAGWILNYLNKQKFLFAPKGTEHA